MGFDENTLTSRANLLEEYRAEIKDEKKRFRLKDLEKIEGDIDLVQLFANKRGIDLEIKNNEQRILCVDNGKTKNMNTK